MKKKSSRWSSQKLVGLGVLLVVLIALATGACLVTQKVRYYNAAANQANMVGIRELVLLAVRGLKKDAPVDARTGDVYFPESHLFLPNPKMALPLTYMFDTGDITDSQGELSISTYPVFGTTELYSAKDAKDMFAAVPKLQACSRGIKLVYKQYPANDSHNLLKHTVLLSNGKTLYIYVEKDCPNLNLTADLLQRIQSY